MPPARAKSGRFAKKGEVERRQKLSEHAKKWNEEARQRKKLKEEDEDREPVLSVGSRIVDLAVLANNLWCKVCLSSLSLRNMEKEVHRGLASILHVRCARCLSVVLVPTSKPVRVEGSGYPLWSVNMKAAAGCLDSGVGHEQFNNLISCMNIPTVNHHTMKRAEARVGPAFEKEAQDSVKRALLEEKRLTDEANRSGCLTPPLTPEDTMSDQDDNAANHLDYANNPISNPTTGVISEYDFGWDRRGSGHDYNSKSGRGAAIGYRTKKIIAVKVTSVDCAMCRAGHKPDDHDCRKNHVGSAKSMEPKGAVDLMVNNKDWLEAGVYLDVLIGDEDASTFAQVQQQSRHQVKKWIDLNHCKGSFSKKLYKLQSRFSFLSSKCIKYLKKCFMYAIQQKRNKPEDLAAALRNVVNHVHGEHNHCGEWCNARGKPTYFFKSLPRGQCWKGGPNDPWRKALTDLMEIYARKAERIAPCASSQNCESFHHMCVTKAPKNRYYASSPALPYRVAAAVLQKNEGADHMTSVNTSCGLSPGGVTAKYRARMEEIRKKKSWRQQTVEFKRRRLQLGNLRKGDTDCVEYASGMASTMERAVAAATDLNAYIPEELPLVPDCAIVIIDTETTGLGGDAEIIQLSARCGNAEFDAYMFPTKKISAQAEEKTGLSVHGGDLYYHTEKVTTKPPADVARDFLAFLAAQGPQVILVGHNAIRFDVPHILKFMSSHGLHRALCSVVYGLADTIPLLRQGKGVSCKQDEMAKKYLTGPEWAGIHQGAHNAATDCHLLQGLLEHFKVDKTKLLAASTTMKAYLEKQAQAKKMKSNLPDLNPLKEYVSTGMLNKMAKHGITIEELKTEFTLHQRQGIEVILGIMVDGKPRVTKCKKIIDKVCECMEQLCGV